MKKAFLLLLLISMISSPLFADDYYQLFTAAMQFNLAKTVNEHTAGWANSSSGGHYTDADMIATIGSTVSAYGYVVEIRPTDGLYFRTRNDWSSKRPFRIEFVMRGQKTNGAAHADLCSTSVNVSGIGVCDAAGRVNRNWTANTGSGIYPSMATGTNDSFYLRMPSNSSGSVVYATSWVDLILVLPPLQSPDDMINTNEYFANFQVLFYPLDSTGRMASSPTHAFDLMLTGFYDGNVGTTASDYFQFDISPLPAASYFDFMAYQDTSVEVGSVFFSTETKIFSKWQPLPTNYEISVGSTADATTSTKFFFKKIGTEDRVNSPSNSINYTVDIIPESGIPAVTYYTNQTSTRAIVNTKSGIDGSESYASRKVQVPVVCTGDGNYGKNFGASYRGKIKVKVASSDVAKLQSGVYRSTLYVHLVSNR